jgi:hypothetical protein
VPRIDKSIYTLDEYDRVFFALERTIHPDRSPGMPDPVIIRATQAVFKALRAVPGTFDQASGTAQAVSSKSST